ncbi:MAG: SpoIID/LytB domain-containing protein [Bacteroidales bacterium]|nr:SpoIID/LytB domain-containing protein [Bacteroidales bacterium]
MKKLLSIVLFCAAANSVFATDINVRIFANQTIQKTQLDCVSGYYRLTDKNGKEILKLHENDNVTLQAEGSRGVRILKGDKELGVFKTVFVIGEGPKNIFRLSPNQAGIRSRMYDDQLDISVENNALRIINIVELENYVAGVIQSEVFGSSNDLDFFKIQAIISRTYAMANLRKHRRDGYNLCDGVHCQAYYGRCNVDKIFQAATETAGSVLVDHNRKMITAAFHANSGGQTINSEDVWVRSTPYLKGVVDTFSFGMRGSTWQKTYTTSDWLDLLHKHYKYNIHDETELEKALSFEQNDRKTHFHGTIPLRSMRTDLDLRSTFFSVRQEGDNIILDGRGYGHGVGLSQEGAVRMIREGFSVEDVLKFYYQNVGLVKIDDLFAGEEQQF